LLSAGENVCFVGQYVAAMEIGTWFKLMFIIGA